MKQIKFLIIALMFIYSCKDNNEDTVKDSFLGQQIILPNQNLIINKNNLSSIAADTNRYNYTVIRFMSGDCPKCVEPMREFNNYMDNLKKNINCIHIINVVDSVFFKHDVYPLLDKKYPIYVNNNHEFEKNNELEGFFKLSNTFIINNQNKITLIGNPLYDEQVSKQFAELLKETERNNSKLTEQYIQFPDSALILLKNGKKVITKDFFNNLKPKLIHIVNAECTGCLNNIFEWDQFVRNHTRNFTIILWIENYPIGNSDILKTLPVNKNIHYYTDYKTIFSQLNNLKSYNLHEKTFLLNANNRIVIKGNPMINKSLLDLYHQKIVELSKTK